MQLSECTAPVSGGLTEVLNRTVPHPPLREGRANRRTIAPPDPRARQLFCFPPHNCHVFGPTVVVQYVTLPAAFPECPRRSPLVPQGHGRRAWRVGVPFSRCSGLWCVPWGLGKGRVAHRRVLRFRAGRPSAAWSRTREGTPRGRACRRGSAVTERRYPDPQTAAKTRSTCWHSLIPSRAARVPTSLPGGLALRAGGQGQ